MRIFIEELLSLNLPRELASQLSSREGPLYFLSLKRITVVPGPTRREETLSLQPRSLKSGWDSWNFQTWPPNLPSLKLGGT